MREILLVDGGGGRMELRKRKMRFYRNRSLAGTGENTSGHVEQSTFVLRIVARTKGKSVNVGPIAITEKKVN